MIINTWNLRHGGGKRIKDIVRVLSENSRTDIFVLTEYRNNSNKEYLSIELEKLGYKYQYNPNSEPKLNSVLIVSKIELKTEIFEILNEHKQRVIKVFNDDFSIYGCYFPLQNLKKDVFEFLLTQVKENRDEKIIIVGDYNTGKHYIDEKGKTFYCSEYFNKLEESGMTDAWRYINNDKKEFSWYSNEGNGFRLDHFFVKSNIKDSIKSCRYIHKYRDEKISDHSMMELEIEEPKNEQTTFSATTMSKSDLEKMKVGDIITLGNQEKTEYESKWIKANDNPFNMEIFDCREYAINMVSTTLNLEVANKFLELRKNDGKEYIGHFPENGVKCEVDLNYDNGGKQLPEGIVFKAKQMEEKWDIYKYANFLYFVRSWTGELVYFSNYVPSQKGFKVDLIVLDDSKIEEEDPFFEFRVVEFLIHSHIIGLSVPHPIPKSLENNPESILGYSFSMFGNRGYFASYE